MIYYKLLLMVLFLLLQLLLLLLATIIIINILFKFTMITINISICGTSSNSLPGTSTMHQVVSQMNFYERRVLERWELMFLL